MWTDELYIYLRVPDNDSPTVLYYLSVLEDVRQTIAWGGDLNDDDKLHWATLDQLLAFPFVPVNSGGGGAHT